VLITETGSKNKNVKDKAIMFIHLRCVIGIMSLREKTHWMLK